MNIVQAYGVSVSSMGTDYSMSPSQIVGNTQNSNRDSAITGEEIEKMPVMRHPLFTAFASARIVEDAIKELGKRNIEIDKNKNLTRVNAEEELLRLLNNRKLTISDLESVCALHWNQDGGTLDEKLRSAAHAFERALKDVAESKANGSLYTYGMQETLMSVFEDEKKGINVALDTLHLLADKHSQYPGKRITCDPSFIFSSSGYHATRQALLIDGENLKQFETRK